MLILLKKASKNCNAFRGFFIVYLLNNIDQRAMKPQTSNGEIAISKILMISDVVQPSSSQSVVK
mgnify:CR=1 FL=1